MPATKTPAKAPAASMTRKNRDRESIYKPGQLSAVFAISSLALIVALVWMVVQDYNRPWKDYQKDYFEKKIALNKAELKQIRAQNADVADEIAAARDASEKAKRALDESSEYKNLLETRHAQKKDELGADAKVKGIKGLLGPAKYIYEMAKRRVQEELQSGHAPDSREVKDAREAVIEAGKDVNRQAQMLFDAETEYRNRAADLAETERTIANMEMTWREHKATLADLESTLTTQQAKLDGLSSLYEKNQWRNAPFADFISPSIKVRQIVLDDIHDEWNFATNRKVDRCITCHTGADKEDFAYFPDSEDEEDVARAELIQSLDVPEYMQAHPGLDLILGQKSPHKMEKIGCSVCHHGVGWSTDFSRASHTPADHDQQREWEQEHDWYKAKYIDFPMIPLEYVQGQCFKCHKEGMAYPVTYEESLDHGMVKDPPDVDKTQKDYVPLGQWADPENPGAPGNRLLGAMEVYDEFRLPRAPRPVDGSDLDIADELYDALMSHYEDNEEVDEEVLDGMVGSYDWQAERYARGYDTITRYGCQGCHKIKDFGQQVGYPSDPPRVGPDLTYIRDKVDEAWLEKWIRHPEAFRIETKMPAFFYFVNKDRNWNAKRTADGKLDIRAVMDAHMLDPKFAKRLGPQMTQADVDRINVEIKAMTTFLLNQRAKDEAGNAVGPIFSRLDEGPDADPTYHLDLPQGDIENGRKLINEFGCSACHVLPEVKAGVGESYEPDSPMNPRFHGDPLLMRGPRLTGLGSKLKGRKWINAWLMRPRHYTSHTLMPNMRIEDQVDPVTGKVIASAAQQRADIIDYLLSFRDKEFEALPRTQFPANYKEILADMYETFFGKTKEGTWLRRRTIEAAAGGVDDASGLATVLTKVGERLMAQHGCFGCHNVAGHENDQPIGVELSRHGIKDLHQLDFGMIPHDLIHHSRQSFFLNKIKTPRIWDYAREKVWQDKTRMPRFNMRMDEDPPADEEDDADSWIPTRTSVVGMLLGFVKEPIKDGALFRPNEYQRDLIAGRRVIKRYGCNNCHTIEGKRGLLWGYLSDQSVPTKVLPPNLFTQGLRTRTEWLHKFLKNPNWLRPIVQVHMPEFELSEAELDALTRYFIRLAGPDQSLTIPQPDSGLVGKSYGGGFENAIDEAKQLFEAHNCNTCHLPEGTPGVEEGKGGVSPPFKLSRERLRHGWVRMLLNEPLHLIDGTSMPGFYSQQENNSRKVDKHVQKFQFELRNDPKWVADFESSDVERKARAFRELARVQMDALTDYVIWHYEDEEPKAEDK